MQYLVNALVAGLSYVLVGIGLGLVLRVCGFLHMAHGILYTVGAYAAYVGVRFAGLSGVGSVILAVAATGLLGIVLQRFVYQGLQRVRGSGLGLLLVSLAVYVVCQNLLSLFFGDETKIVDMEDSIRVRTIVGARITTLQLGALSVTCVLCAGWLILLTYSALGRQIRAVASDRELAGICGVPAERIALCSAGLAAMLAGAGGCFVALDTGLSPTMGMRVMMMGLVALVVGGVDGWAGVMVGAIALALGQQGASVLLGSQWQDAFAFVLLLVCLLVRPQGVFGRSVRKVTV